MRASIVAKLRSDFEVVEGKDYETAYRLLQEASLDVLLLALPMESGGLRECTEMLSRLACGDIDTLVIVLSTDQTKSTALKVIDAGCYDYFIQPIDPDVLRLLLSAPSKSSTFSARTASCARKSAAKIRWEI